MNCIRQFLAKHAKCKPVHGSVPEPYYRAQTRALLPNINSTLTLDDVEYKGLNGRVQEFSINRESDKLVLAVEFRNLYTASDRTHFTVYRRAREPITTVDFLKVLYKSMTITIVIPDLKSLKLEQAETFSYVDDGAPRITIGPNAFNSPDPTVRRAAAEFYPSLPIGVREAYLTEGSFIIITFIQKTLCDFGLNVL
ncbi:fibrohexamerin-like [Aricia agestis]|uniref:fibrohexamerin-like n=1 Tax=Aricia agestis TaxID=91739 RepID=UPI001C20886E|nr:fibrohexamerin-like [Aricia agestis]